MKRWRTVAIPLLGLVMLLSLASTALAQGDEDLPPILGGILVKIAAIVDGILDFWVVGNTLTDPLGEQLASSLAQLAHNVVNFLAEFFEVLTFG